MLMQGLEFNFYALALILFFSLGVYLFERKQNLYGYFCIMIGFYILAGFSIVFESVGLMALSIGINIGIICKLIWDIWAMSFIRIFMLIAEYINIKRLINAKTKNKK